MRALPEGIKGPHTKSPLIPRNVRFGAFRPEGGRTESSAAQNDRWTPPQNMRVAPIIGTQKAQSAQSNYQAPLEHFWFGIKGEGIQKLVGIYKKIYYTLTKYVLLEACCVRLVLVCAGAKLIFMPS